uniref:F-box domain-containing protein n=1 Tax=Psilocybe cubensis TaxID=181762 RepID=A0A8H7Y2C3_PSICU
MKIANSQQVPPNESDLGWFTLSSMNSIQSLPLPELPQDIIELIIDHVAILEPAAEARTSLQACSLVSRSFTYRARQQLWRNVVFPLYPGTTKAVPGSINKRANQFIHTLQQMQDKGFISDIHSFHLVFEDPPQTSFKLKSLQQRLLYRPITRLFKKSIIKSYDIFYVFEELKKRQLRHISIENKPKNRLILFWNHNPETSSLQMALLQLLASATLRTFTLSNITGLTSEIVIAAFFSKNLQEIMIHHSVVKHNGRFGESPNISKITGELANLTRLELTGGDYFEILYILVKQAEKLRIQQSPLFPQLQTLVLSVPGSEDIMFILCENILNFASNLQNIEFELHHAYFRDEFFSHDYIESFSHMDSLFTFRLRTIGPSTVKWVESSQQALINFLAIRNLGKYVTTIELHYHFSGCRTHTEGDSLGTFNQAKYWEAVDRILTSEVFIHLQLVKIWISIRYYPSMHNKTYPIPPEELDDFAEFRLPRINKASHIRLELNGEFILSREQAL